MRSSPCMGSTSDWVVIQNYPGPGFEALLFIKAGFVPLGNICTNGYKTSYGVVSGMKLR